MENASKALIIAGAILISIILISIGMMIITQSQTVIGEAGAQLDATAIQAFNAYYTGYGGRQRGSTVRTIAQRVVAGNAADQDKQITMKYQGSEHDASWFLSNLSSTKYYNIDFVFAGPKEKNSGILKEILITDGDTSGGGSGNTIGGNVT